ncbi:hypothetical protein BASA81_015593 [Batrachochytrium salamandrivorans]|nr:hypothetical protein BASA81_015593 [Batrachochytrium salamandrivorans]
MLSWRAADPGPTNKVALPRLIPPFRFNIVEGSTRQEAVYRSAFPTSKNFRFLKRLKLKTIISLIPRNAGAEGEDDLRKFCLDHSISHQVFPVSGTQEPLANDENDLNAPAPTHALCANVLTLCIDPDRLPVLIHCTNGAHVTGLIIALLRRLQKYSVEYYVEEFARFTKNHSMDQDEESFIGRFFLEITLPGRLPGWLWGGERLSRHPTLPLFGAAVSVGISNEDWNQDKREPPGGLLMLLHRQEEELLQRHMSSTSPSSSMQLLLNNSPPLPGPALSSSVSPSSLSSLSATATANAAARASGRLLSAAAKSMVNEDDEEEDGPRGLALEAPTALFRRRSNNN